MPSPNRVYENLHSQIIKHYDHVLSAGGTPEVIVSGRKIYGHNTVVYLRKNDRTKLSAQEALDVLSEQAAQLELKAIDSEDSQESLDDAVDFEDENPTLGVDRYIDERQRHSRMYDDE